MGAIRFILRSITCPRLVWTPEPPAMSPIMSSTIPLSLELDMSFLLELTQLDMSFPLVPTQLDMFFPLQPTQLDMCCLLELMQLDTSLDTTESLLEPSPPLWLLLRKLPLLKSKLKERKNNQGASAGT